MKTVIITLFLSAAVLAGNPDERPSVAVSIGGSLLGGDFSIFDDYGSSIGQDVEGRDFFIGTEMISPANDDMSVVFTFYYVNNTRKTDSTPLLYEQEQKISGISASIGIKIYLGK